MCLYLADLYTTTVDIIVGLIYILSDLFAWMCLLARHYTILIHTLIAMCVTHSSVELGPNKVVCYG